MKDVLAERLLAHVLQWEPEDGAREQPVLQSLAAYKYDEYSQFSAGSRFIENLTLWLNQFETTGERQLAYDFVKRQLVFCSTAEMLHLAEIAYPDHIRPILLGRTAEDLGINPHHVAKVAARSEFAVRQRQSLFLGLSDGARIDTFRRANRDLNHEQISQTYELSEQRVEKLLGKLREHLRRLLQRDPDPTDCKFRTLILLDDFSASGTSYYACREGDIGGGKIAGLFDDLDKPSSPASQLVDLERFEVIILLYVATEQALEHLRKCSERLWGSKKIRWHVDVVQLLPSSLRLAEEDGNSLSPLIDKYYDHDVFDPHFEKGGTKDARYGFAACGLPVVLHHNTPNNSIVLLWSYEDKKLRGLFPRVQRHKEMS